MTRLSPPKLALPKIDKFLLALIAAVILAAIMPARGEMAEIVTHGVTAAVALLFFLYGARLSRQAVVEGLSHWRLQGLVLASTYLLFPLLGLVLTGILRSWIPADLATGFLFLCVLPSTVQSSIAFTAIARGNVPAALCSASVSNMLGVVLTPMLVALLLQGHGGGLNPRALVEIGLQLLLPFALGQVARPWLASILERHRRVTALVDRGSIVLVVYAAFSEGMVAGMWGRIDLSSLLLVLALDTILLATVLVSTTAACRWLGFSREDEIAIVFCGSKKSMAGGIPMANILFPGPGVALVVLPLMLFHQAQLFACAALARRYAARGEGPDVTRPVQAPFAPAPACLPASLVCPTPRIDVTG